MKRLTLFIVVAMLSLTLTTAQINRNPDLSLLWEQVYAQPDDFSVACMVLIDPGSAVFYNNVPFPLASVSKLLTFIEYVRRINNGDIEFTEMVAIDDLNRFDVPRTDGGAHDDFLSIYPADVEELTLWDVAATGMLQYSSNAASDYVLDRISPVDWDELYDMLGIRQSDYPHPLNMIPLLMNNHETGQLTLEDIETLSPARGEALFSEFVENELWRERELAYRAEQRRNFPAWEVQAALLQERTMTGTVSDFLNVMRAIYSEDSALSEDTRRVVREALRWRGYAGIAATYVEYGSKLGFYSGGLQTLVAYGSPYTGLPVISVSFLRNIPRDRYRDMLEEDTIGILAHWMNLNSCRGLEEALP